MEHGVCIRVLGDLTLLPPDTCEAVAEVVRFSKNNTKYEDFLHNTKQAISTFFLPHNLRRLQSERDRTTSRIPAELECFE
jgi:hypothetical protein